MKKSEVERVKQIAKKFNLKKDKTLTDIDFIYSMLVKENRKKVTLNSKNIDLGVMLVDLQGFGTFGAIAGFVVGVGLMLAIGFLFK